MARSSATPRVLVVCLTYRLYRRTLASLLRLSYPALDLVFIVNTDHTGDAQNEHQVPLADLERLVASRGALVLPYHNEHEPVYAGDKRPTYEQIVRKYNQARDLANLGDYTALLTVESDMLVPPDTVQKLLPLDADVAYGLYCWRHGHPWWNLYTYLDHTFGRSISFQSPEVARRVWGWPVACAGVGQGCTLIHRHVLDRLTFRRDRGGQFACADWYFALDCQYHGLRQVCHTGVVCGHISEELPAPPEGELSAPRVETAPYIIWPDAARPRLYRVEPLEPVELMDEKQEKQCQQ